MSVNQEHENFLQRHRESQQEYNLELVDTLATAVQDLRNRLTAESQGYREVAEGFMTTDSRKLLRDAEGLIWKLSWDIDAKRESQLRGPVLKRLSSTEEV